MRTARFLQAFGTALATGALAIPAWAAEPSSGARDRAAELAALIKAYPDFLDRTENGHLVWKDGTRMRIDDGVTDKEPADRLANADIDDMFFDAYPRGPATAIPAPGSDPGRYRPSALFKKMYGDCEKDEVRANLVDVPWLPSRGGGTVRITRINGVAEQLRKVSEALEKLPEGLLDFVIPPTQTYECRAIAGTERSSAHGYGIAIDINVALAQYWRYERAADDGSIAYKNAIPEAIVAAFEDHGFIWGGRWYHYDTAHFEYRPELLSIGAAPSN